MRSCLYAAALLLALPAGAQDHPAPPAGSNEIVVVGRDVPEDQVRAFVTGMTRSLSTKPLARFDREELCPRAIGLAPNYEKAITERMRRVAAASKIRLARDDCQPNALVIFANDKDAMIKLMRKGYPALFQDAAGDSVTIPKEEGPAAAWHLTGLVDRDGRPLQSGGSGDPYVVRAFGSGSRISAMVRPVFLMSIVVIERGALQGLTTTQVADYAAMRAFTDADPARARKTGVPTILTVLETPMGEAMPLSITEWDLNFIRALYAASPNLLAPAQRGAISSQMKRALDKTGDAKR
ncbi:MAG: hypothetical protein ABW023_09080 [Sphingomonas sp.]